MLGNCIAPEILLLREVYVVYTYVPKCTDLHLWYDVYRMQIDVTLKGLLFTRTIINNDAVSFV